MIGLVLLATIKNAYLLGNSWMWNQIETVLVWWTKFKLPICKMFQEFLLRLVNFNVCIAYL